MQDDTINDVILTDEDGQDVTFEHLLTFLYEGERYVALSPIEQADDDEAEVVLLKIQNDNGADTYVSIDNEVLLNEVFDAFLELMDEYDGDEDEDQNSDAEKNNK
ncbi:MAG: DUF1292 domain-containing protein [Clostridia bacterium]